MSEKVTQLFTKCMRAYGNGAGLACEECGDVSPALYQFWSLLPGEDALSESVVKLLPKFCSLACWRTFVDGKRYSDRAAGVKV